MKNFTVDNMPKDAVPLYDCNIDAIPVVFKTTPFKGVMIRARKQKDKRRYTVPLYKINEKTLESLSYVLGVMRKNDWDLFHTVLCIRGNEIGLACHDCPPHIKHREGAVIA